MKVLRDLGLNINEDIFISGLTSSSGLIEKDQCFIALQGLRSHGLDYIDEAIANGASCVLHDKENYNEQHKICLLYTSPSPRDRLLSRMPSSA